MTGGNLLALWFALGCAILAIVYGVWQITRHWQPERFGGWVRLLAAHIPVFVVVTVVHTFVMVLLSAALANQPTGPWGSFLSQLRGRLSAQLLIYTAIQLFRHRDEDPEAHDVGHGTTASLRRARISACRSSAVKRRAYSEKTARCRGERFRSINNRVTLPTNSGQLRAPERLTATASAPMS